LRHALRFTQPVLGQQAHDVADLQQGRPDDGHGVQRHQRHDRQITGIQVGAVDACEQHRQANAEHASGKVQDFLGIAEEVEHFPYS